MPNIGPSGAEGALPYMSGIQALVHLPMLQRQRDEAAGLNTAGFISGYRGSPLGGYDKALDESMDALCAVMTSWGQTISSSSLRAWGSSN